MHLVLLTLTHGALFSCVCVFLWFAHFPWNFIWGNFNARIKVTRSSRENLSLLMPVSQGHCILVVTLTFSLLVQCFQPYWWQKYRPQMSGEISLTPVLQAYEKNRFPCCPLLNNRFSLWPLYWSPFGVAVSSSIQESFSPTSPGVAFSTQTRTRSLQGLKLRVWRRRLEWNRGSAHIFLQGEKALPSCVTSLEPFLLCWLSGVFSEVFIYVCARLFLLIFYSALKCFSLRAVRGGGLPCVPE